MRVERLQLALDEWAKSEEVSPGRSFRWFGPGIFRLAATTARLSSKTVVQSSAVGFVSEVDTNAGPDEAPT